MKANIPSYFSYDKNNCITKEGEKFYNKNTNSGKKHEITEGKATEKFNLVKDKRSKTPVPKSNDQNNHPPRVNRFGVDSRLLCRQHSRNSHDYSDGSSYKTSLRNNRINFEGNKNSELKSILDRGGSIKNALYVITSDRRILIHKDSKTFKHNLFITDSEGYGSDVLCAGHLDINKDGRITKINSGSGHYKPNNTHLENILSIILPVLDRDCIIHDSHKGKNLNFNLDIQC